MKIFLAEIFPFSRECYEIRFLLTSERSVFWIKIRFSAAKYISWQNFHKMWSKKRPFLKTAIFDKKRAKMHDFC